jgi:hypothetical protein
MDASAGIPIDNDEAEGLIVSTRRVLALAASTVQFVSRDPNWVRHPALWGEDGVIQYLHCRKNGRLFRLKALEKADTPLAPRFEVLEVKGPEEKDRKGITIGRYRTCRDASKAVLEVAYKPEW